MYIIIIIIIIIMSVCVCVCVHVCVCECVCTRAHLGARTYLCGIFHAYERVRARVCLRVRVCV